MAYYHELTTVKDVRDTYLSIIGSADDTLMLGLIRSVSSDIATAARRQFVPRIETRYRDANHARRGKLWLDDDLMSATTITNGDGTTVSASDYAFDPRHSTPYYAVQLLGSSGLSWTYDTDPENAISILGVWGCDLGWQPNKSEWVATDTLGAAISSTSTTSMTQATADVFKPGQLLKCDNEYMYCSAEAGAAGTTVRGVNGSTATTHLISAPIYVWAIESALAQLATEATAARYRLRNNPIAENFVTLDGTTLIQPRDVDAYIKRRVAAMGLVREAFA